MEKLRVLIVEDNSSECRLIERALMATDKCHKPVVANDYESALYNLRSTYFHLILLDLNLHTGKPHDKESYEGLWLLQDIQVLDIKDCTQIVLLSSYGTLEIVEEAFSKYGISRFIEKNENFKETILTNVFNDVINSQKINCDLKIEFKDNLSFDDLISPLIRRVYSKLSLPPQNDLLTEIKNIFLQLYSDANKIEIYPMQQGFSGTGVVKIVPHYASIGSKKIIKYGTIEQIKKEQSNYKDYVIPYSRGEYHTSLERYCRTLHIGALVYSFIGDDEDAVDFESFYFTNDKQSAIKNVINNIFNKTMRLWNINTQDKHNCDIVEVFSKHLHLNKKNLSEAFEFKFEPKYVFEDYFELDGVRGKYRNPVKAFCNDEILLNIDSYFSIVHGDLNGKNIYVDKNDNTWLIDFYQTGYNHYLFDLIELESVIKFQLLPNKNISITDLHDIENYLLIREKFGNLGKDDLSNFNRQIKKALASINTIRSIALERSKSGDIYKEYLTGLFLYTLNHLRFHRLIRNRLKKFYVLLSAAMIFEEINRLK